MRHLKNVPAFGDIFPIWGYLAEEHGTCLPLPTMGHQSSTSQRFVGNKIRKIDLQIQELLYLSVPSYSALHATLPSGPSTSMVPKTSMHDVHACIAGV